MSTAPLDMDLEHLTVGWPALVILIGALVTALLWIISGTDKLRKELIKVKEDLSKQIDKAKEESAKDARELTKEILKAKEDSDREIEKATLKSTTALELFKAEERTDRHDLNNKITADMFSLSTELKRIERETVRREDLKEMNARTDQIIEKLSVKIDRLADQIPEMAVLKEQSQRNGQLLQEISNRMNEMQKIVGINRT